MKLKSALLLDNLILTKWQKQSLKLALNKLDIVLILNCTNTKSKKKYIKNFIYYLLNIISLKNSLTNQKTYNISDEKVYNFDSKYNGIWQSIPDEIYEILKKNNIDLVIKFGMNLLRIKEDKSAPPFISFHHGDPSKYRGRPAGFYEILNRENSNGIIVQKLSNELDAGEILAFAESKVVNYSYKRTALNFYDNSKYLLLKAIKNYSLGKEVNINKCGKNYRLPSNFLGIKFFLLTFNNAIKRFIYGLFFEKKWKVLIGKSNLSFSGNEVISLKNMSEIPLSSEYNFYADPFFSSDGRFVRLEALSKNTSLGDILEFKIDDFSVKKKLLSGEHYSYPFSFIYKEKEYLLPEVESHSAQYIYPLDNENNEKFTIRGLEDKRIVDATFLEHNGDWFLFFGENSNANSVLNLWLSKSPFGMFKPHPDTPIAISPKFARMGGRVLKMSDRLVRFGQNNSGEYGESLTVLEITKLSPTEYKEKIVGELSFDSYKGPHSLNLNINSNLLLLDYYINKFSFFAGYRRIKAKFNRK
tara:strand:- start:54 stop:1637 length:1584 start_codon:yes stop_codon:yes gene_type:complete